MLLGIVKVDKGYSSYLIKKNIYDQEIKQPPSLSW